VPDLRWDQVGELFDPDLMGSLPDLFVPDATVHDWQAVLDLVTTSGWEWRFEIGAVEQPLQTATSIFARGAGAETAELRAWPVPGVLAIFRFLVGNRDQLRRGSPRVAGTAWSRHALCLPHGDRGQAGQAGTYDTGR
jgi:hypothetical protein